jgi:hypothetical protein
VYLAGGLAPRYIVGSVPEGARPHVGTTDIDLVIGLAVVDESPEAYRTLENNLKRAEFKPKESFRWTKDVEGVTVILEFLCETDRVDAGRIFNRSKAPGLVSALSTSAVPNSSRAITSNARLKRNGSMAGGSRASPCVSPTFCPTRPENPCLPRPPRKQGLL